MKRIIAFIVCVLMIASLSGCDIYIPYQYSNESLPFSAPGSDYESQIPPESNEVHSSSKKGKQENIIDLREAKNLEEAEITDGDCEYICYSKLNKSQKRYYRIMYTAAKSMTEGWINLGKPTDDFERDVSISYSALISDRPEFFWLSHDYMICVNEYIFPVMNKAFIAFNAVSGEDSCSYIVNKTQKAEMEKTLNQKINQISHNMAGISSDIEKEIYIHDYICSNTLYGEGDDPLTYSAYGGLVSGNAVCEGYSRAIQLLCNKVGIPCILINGISQNEPHMWNLVKIDGEWYHLDSTWNDDDIYTHTYFNVTDKEILADHTLDPLFYDTPTEELSQGHNFFAFDCDSESANYYIYKELILDYDPTTAAEKICAADISGKKCIEFRINDQTLINHYNTDHRAAIQPLRIKLENSEHLVDITHLSIVNNIIMFYW